MADKFNLGNEVRELKIGQSFTNPKAIAFHTIRYDFKPASVDINKSATIDVANTNQVTLTVPHLDGAGVPHTVFKGSQKPFQKECVLIIDKITGEVTLEKLTGNIQVKKTRNESAKITHNNDIRNTSGNSLASVTSNQATSNNRSLTPPIGQRQSNKTKVTSGSRRAGADRQMIHMVPRHSPLHASPNPGYASTNSNALYVQSGGNASGTSPGHGRSPKRDRISGDRDQDVQNQSSLASLPMIGMDDFSNVRSSNALHVPISSGSANSVSHTVAPSLGLLTDLSTIGEITDSSSSSSSSDSDDDDDDDDSDKEEPPTNKKLAAPPSSSNTWNHNNTSGIQTTHTNGLSSQNHSKNTVQNAHILNQDLDLSESGSDSD